MFYDPLFEFGQTLEDPSNTLSILELFNEAVGKVIYDKCIEDSDWSPIEDPYYYLNVISHVPFLACKCKTCIICYGVPCSLHVPQPFHGIIRSCRKLNPIPLKV